MAVALGFTSSSNDSYTWTSLLYPPKVNREHSTLVSTHDMMLFARKDVPHSHCPITRT
jgi:hypothetical protein